MAAFLYLAFRDIEDFDSLWSEMAAVSPWWILAIILTILLTGVIRAWRWVVLMRPVAPQVTLLDATLSLCIGYSVNLVSPIPRAGEAARALSLKWTRQASISAVFGTIVVERVIDVLWLLILIAASAALLPGQIEEAFPGIRLGAMVALALSVAAVTGLVIVSAYRERGVEFVYRLLAKVSERLARPIADLLSQFIHGLQALRNPSAYVEILLSSLLLNLGYALITWFSFAAFGYHEDPWHLGGRAAIVVMAISSIGVVVPLPGGIGSYHLFYGRSLHLLFAIPLASTMACATVVHAVSNLTYFAVGAPALLLQRRRHGDHGSLAEEFEQVSEDTQTADS
ncbi:MAG: lysylphosphatidylglycerol synthase transmembrane domain-containing protein [Candidatus Latescibacteria bacterium]|jgi:hypothetical protein|nr:lysylphosphatidylglycerol synthase transmembrane domain-containing protein [Candidatus Latescibacterota bacterium]MDP7450110.1 lysylphosphatidylglycerol synthase transmembrane domain-containing protein [Candidatus Latescibacterota bacterium]HJP30738.1 lysylphosphatidylglycerol synthase transmembrane domain-containing protein [Candidatus Latescibacterota bacterium]